MRRSFGSRALLNVSFVLVTLLAVLMVVQYRWSTRVAAADTQREKEHLDSAALLFANEFDDLVAQTIGVLQERARPALQTKAPLTGVPKLIAQLYYIEAATSGTLRAKRLAPDGLFEPSTTPDWLANRSCAPLITEQPPTLVISIYDVTMSESRSESGIRIYKALSQHPDRCFAGLVDLSYLRNTLFPQLIRQSFGETTARQYDFTVISRAHTQNVIYGKSIRADLRKPFFSISPLPPVISKAPPPGTVLPDKGSIFVQRVQTAVLKGRAGLPDLFGPGIWELDIAHKGLPLAAVFERTRQLDLLFSLAVELLLVVGIIFLLMTARRMQRLADQKMHFVAGVSHELRTPVSAIAMLSRNQADGLVTGTEKVKQYGELIHQQSRRLSNMVEQTLQYADIHSGLRRPLKDEIALSRLIQDAIDVHREELVRSGFTIEVMLSPDLPPIVGDLQLLRTAFDNLLSNAQKHAEGGQWIRVSAHYSAVDKEVRISVEDHGAGIDPADQVDIFEPFLRGRAAVQAQIPGSGLGLSLVRNAAEAHHGTVTLESALGRGSTFTLHLPV